MTKETAETAQNMFGEATYQRRAREAMPLLVRQALSQTPIYYSDLAAELGMPNPRNLNFVLGSVGRTMTELSAELKHEVPPIQALVRNRATDMPGEGVGQFLNPGTFRALTSRQKQLVVDAALLKIYTYPDWLFVLKKLSLAPAPFVDSTLLTEASSFCGGGEGEAHRRFKKFIAENPQVVGLPARTQAEMERGLPSGDRVDVIFTVRNEVVACEVKAASSSMADLVRGLFQCIKYKAILEASLSVQGHVVAARAVLALEGTLPKELVHLRNMLGISVFERCASDD